MKRKRTYYLTKGQLHRYWPVCRDGCILDIGDLVVSVRSHEHTKHYCLQHARRYGIL